MKALRLRKPSLALIIALIALFISLGGTSYAAINLPAGSVGTKQLKKAAVTTAKIKNEAVSNAKIGPGAVTTAKIANGAVTAAKINAAGLTVPHATAADSAAPSGAAGGALNGTYPNPTLAAGAVADASFSAAGATSVAEAGGVIVVSGTNVPSVNDSFNRLSSTAISVSRTSVGFYEITIPGINYFWRDHITQLTLLNSGPAWIARVDSVGGHLVVRTFDLTGALTDPTNGGFTFVVYK